MIPTVDSPTWRRIPVAALLLLALFSCSQEKPDNGSTSVAPEPVELAAPESRTQAPAEQPTPNKALDLSRGALAEELDTQDAGPDIADRTPALPDMFDDDKQGKRLTTSGRVLTDEEAGVSVDALDGVELSIELKTN